MKSKQAMTNSTYVYNETKKDETIRFHFPTELGTVTDSHNKRQNLC